MLQHPTLNHLRLLKLEDLESDRWQEHLPWQTAPAYLAVAWWLRTFVAETHPGVGRGGAVCPFVRPAIERQTLWLDGYEAAVDRSESVVDILAPYLRWFSELPPLTGEDQVYKTILVVFPGLHNEAGFKLLDEAHLILKPLVVPQGLMVGQFHPLSNEPGVRRAEFRPTRSPAPLMAIRNMTSFDLPFLLAPQFLPEYEKRFANSVPNRLRPLYQQAKAGVVAG